MKKQRGFILSTTLILTAVIILLLLSMMESFHIQQRLVSLSLQKTKQDEAKQIATNFLSSLDSKAISPNCIFTWDGSFATLEKQAAQRNTCRIIIRNAEMHYILLLPLSQIIIFYRPAGAKNWYQLAK